MENLFFKAINYISQTSESNFLPYHGIDHLYTVYLWSDIIAEHSDLSENRTELLIAALFHDYNHSGGVLTDSENITNAIIGLKQFHLLHPEFNLEYACYLIKCTEYPYKIEDNELDEYGQVIRDADMSYMFEAISTTKLYTGLRTEFKQDLKTFYKNQYNFLTSLKFYTKYASDLWENVYKNVRLKNLEDLMKNV